MASKDELKAGSKNSSNTMRIIATGNTEDVEEIPDTKDTRGTKKEIYRFNLNLPIDLKDYLHGAAYRASNERHTCTITEYVTKLIEDDKAKYEAGLK